jgi:hypothetical protein
LERFGRGRELGRDTRVRDGRRHCGGGMSAEQREKEAAFMSLSGCVYDFFRPEGRWCISIGIGFARDLYWIPW